MKAIHYSFLVTVFAFLVACGGGGGTTTTDAGGNTIRTTNYPNWIISSASSARATAQGQVWNSTAANLRELILSGRSSASRFLMSDGVSVTASGLSRLSATCRGGRTCSIEGVQISLDDDIPGLRVAEYQPLFTRNGIDIGQIRTRLENAPTTGQHINTVYLGGILDNSFFAIEISTIYQGAQLTSGIGGSYTFGNSPGTNPISNATWTGSMLGIDYSQVTSSVNQLQPLHGDASIVVEGLGATPTVDVNFSNVRNLNTGARHTLSGWSNIPLSNGIFRTGSTSSLLAHKIEGTFYGSEHQEVGGHFETGAIVGAFGAKREE